MYLKLLTICVVVSGFVVYSIANAQTTDYQLHMVYEITSVCSLDASSTTVCTTVPLTHNVVFVDEMGAMDDLEYNVDNVKYEILPKDDFGDIVPHISDFTE